MLQHNKTQRRKLVGVIEEIRAINNNKQKTPNAQGLLDLSRSEAQKLEKQK